LDERAVLVSGPVVVFKWRNEPGWPVEYVSPNAEEVFGYTADDFLSGRVVYADLIVDEDAERVGAEVRVASESYSIAFVHEPYRVRHRAGTVRWLYDSTRIMRGPDGTATHYLGYVIDITARVVAEAEKRELERRLLHAQKLESLGVLAGGVAHDFNNLLTGIMGHAGLALRQLERNPVAARDGIEQIERLAQRASHLTRQLLAYAGRGRFVVEPLDLADIIRDMLGMLEVTLPKKAKLVLELMEPSPAIVADRAELQQVVMNLLTNAAEALGDGAGTVTIRTWTRKLGRAELERELPHESLTPGEYVSLEVADTGCGMDESVVAKLFDPFFTTKQSGRGLGMSAVLGIVRGHGGAVRVSSTAGVGSTFHLLFPISSVPAAAPKDPAAPIDWRGKGTILVVDDERTIRSILSATLAGMGFSTLLAANGAEAISIFDKNVADVVLAFVDMTMPVMGGAETLVALRERAPALPVVLMSGYSEQHAQAQLADARVVAFLEKPYTIAQIEEVIHRLLPAGGLASRR
jgi:PAS domain S-box-containing protein